MPGRKRHHRRKPASITPLEKVVQRQIKDAAWSLGFEVMDMSQPRASMMPIGLPDIYMRHSAKQFRCFVEVKRDGGRLSTAQRAWLEAERVCGGVAFVADSVESFIEQLEVHGFPVHMDGAA